MNSSKYHFSVLPADVHKGRFFPLRIDQFLRLLIPELSKRKISEISKEGKLRVNNRKASPGEMLLGSEEILLEVILDPLIPSSKRISEKSSYTLEVIYEDEDMIAVCKPRGMHSVLQKHNDPLTLADLLADYYPAFVEAGRDPKESGLVQRLDYWTSGVILAAKNRKVWEFLHEQFLSKNVKKTYLAQINNTKIIPIIEKSEVKVEFFKQLNDKTLIRVLLRDGSRHIVRKTLAKAGFPLQGDIEYGGDIIIDDGFFLHAESLTFLSFKNESKNIQIPSAYFSSL